MHGGPWFLFGHHLMLTPWKPNFRSSQNHFSSLIVWVRFLELPIEYFNKRALFGIAKLAGIKWILLLIQLAVLAMLEFLLKFRYLNHSSPESGWLVDGNRLSMKTLTYYA